MKKEFSIDTSYKTSWGVFKKNPFYIVGFFIALFFSGIVIFILIASLSAALKEAGWLTQIISWAVSALFTIATLTFLLNLFRGKKMQISKRLQDWRLIVKIFFASFLSTVIVIAGIILLIIPGVVFAMRLKFVNYFVVDKNASPIEAISLSWNATKGNTFKLFLLTLLNGLVNILGFLVFVVGLSVTTPLTQMVNTKVYLTLSGEK